MMDLALLGPCLDGFLLMSILSVGGMKRCKSSAEVTPL